MKFLLLATVMVSVGAVWIRAGRGPVTPALQSSTNPLDLKLWTPFRDGTFHESAIDAVGGLRLAADTRGAPSGTWQHLGVRRHRTVSLKDGARIAVKVSGGDDPSVWGSMVLTPEAVRGNPKGTSEWIALSWGAGLLRVSTCVQGVEQVLFEDAVEKSRPKVEIRFRPGAFHILEGEIPIFDSPSSALPFETGHLYLMLTSEADQPLRELRFHELEIRRP